MSYDKWYENIEAVSPITQGDLIFDCPILKWNSEKLNLQGSNETESLETATDALLADVVVMTQACDLEYQKVSNVILCPHIDKVVTSNFGKMICR